ncbi:MAG: tricarballylate utilization 4Fe-4S protein TcuB [Pseudomonadota bacterium]
MLEANPLSAQGSFEEARRQIGICNACRYCEGYCAVFPAITASRHFGTAEITQLANLCHNCRGCYYACQYSEPHAFAVNLPAALAHARFESWRDLAWPGSLAAALDRSGTLIAALVVVATAAILWLAQTAGDPAATGFYAYIGHGAMIAIFLPAFVLPLVTIAVSLRRYWRRVGGRPLVLADVSSATRAVLRLENLSGGQGQGCNFERGERFSNTRRWAHQATLAGFLLCLASTSSATVMHYALDWPAPYGPLTLPKLLGVPGGVLLAGGCAALAWLKLRAAPKLGDAPRWGAEMAFVLLLLGVALTGLALYAATGTGWVRPLLAIHLATVLTFFLLTPYSKMVHGFYRTAALLRDAQRRRDLRAMST